MYFDLRLCDITRGVRLRLLGAVALGVLGVLFGIARLALLGWLIAAGVPLIKEKLPLAGSTLRGHWLSGLAPLGSRPPDSSVPVLLAITARMMSRFLPRSLVLEVGSLPSCVMPGRVRQGRRQLLG